jgi:hypothetical protein
MNGRLLSITLFVLLLTLGIVLVASDRSISRLMEDCGEFITWAFGF